LPDFIAAHSFRDGSKKKAQDFSLAFGSGQKGEARRLVFSFCFNFWFGPARPLLLVCDFPVVGGEFY
jgi:hypothetical protein